jgi:hypothetical protein
LKPAAKDEMSATASTAKELLARLVAFDTTSSKTNIPLIDFVEAYLSGHGIESRRVPTPDGLKASLFATIGPSDAGGFALSGHTDVVPVAAQSWDTDPFTLTERDGKLYGRGSCDMKGYLACCLAIVPDLKARKLKVPFHIAFSYDEETGCTGVRPMIAELGKSLPRPRMVFVGEPSNMGVVDAHKGPVRWRVELTGRAAHSACHVQRHPSRAAPPRRARPHGRELKSGRASYFDPPWTTLQAQIEAAYRLQRRAGAVLVRLGDPRCRASIAALERRSLRRGNVCRDAAHRIGQTSKSRSIRFPPTPPTPSRASFR